MIRWIVILLAGCFSTVTLYAGFDEEQARDKVIELLSDLGLEDQLDAPVRVSTDDKGLLSIVDEGNYLIQYGLMTPAKSADAEIIVSDDLRIKPTACNFVIAVHGWLDRGDDHWPNAMAEAYASRTDPNSWVCGYFDWRGGAGVATPMDAARYSCDVAGPRLAKALLSLPNEIKHLHLIGHSAGSWAIDTAAERLARETGATVHLTFLDAYIPPKWDKTLLGEVSSAPDDRVFVEHYYTRDVTYQCTEEDLPEAVNVDVTEIDFGIKEHEFPYRWYRATAEGEYRKSDLEYGQDVVFRCGEVDYGFARGLEAGPDSWRQSLELPCGEKAVKMQKPQKKPLLRFF